MKHWNHDEVGGAKGLLSGGMRSETMLGIEYLCFALHKRSRFFPLAEVQVGYLVQI